MCPTKKQWASGKSASMAVMDEVVTGLSLALIGIHIIWYYGPKLGDGGWLGSSGELGKEAAQEGSNGVYGVLMEG